ncbi:prephenate dehydrogenase/arogenate dehydrogenase family protein [Prosthecobacter sp. SYSU 5D2]|uniref:prephenate dehydrogenase n=1 Tax=Prosthecobacter sp. SYSU 5D2 TaxID=3134134 RepID=UPI0031FECB2F
MSSETTIAIYGPGLLGGSLALAIQERMPGIALRLWARRDTAEAGIRDRGIQAEFFTDATAAAQGASLIILCTPVETMPAQAAQIAKADLSADCLITDVGSVKGSVVRALEPILGSRFIGSHPMAGSEKAGIETARSCLFQNATCLITPGARTPPSTSKLLLRLRTFWQALGCNVLEMSPEEHDEKVARISHLPHMMAAITTLAALRTDPAAVACVANGFRDTTRVAGGDPGLWTGIALENRQALLVQLQTASTTLTELLEILGKPDEEELRRFLAEAQSLRRTVPAAVS